MYCIELLSQPNSTSTWVGLTTLLPCYPPHLTHPTHNKLSVLLLLLTAQLAGSTNNWTPTTNNWRSRVSIEGVKQQLDPISDNLSLKNKNIKIFFIGNLVEAKQLNSMHSKPGYCLSQPSLG